MAVLTPTLRTLPGAESKPSKLEVEVVPSLNAIGPASAVAAIDARVTKARASDRNMVRSLLECCGVRPATPWAWRWRAGHASTRTPDPRRSPRRGPGDRVVRPAVP